VAGLACVSGLRGELAIPEAICHDRRVMRALSDREIAENAARLGRAAGLILLIVLIGIIGYRIVGGPESDLLSAIYMTMITLTTVGYGEVIDLTASPGGRVFTICLLFIGAGSFVYFFSNLTAFIVEGNLDRYLWRRRMKNEIAALNDHIIVCGAGATGRNVIRELVSTKRTFVVIDTNEEQVRELYEEFEAEFPLVVGDATDDDFLIEAGIEQANGVIATVRNDRDNLIITVSAKILKPSLRVIARCIDSKMVKKAKQAGAASVISPNVIGGMRMVSETCASRISRSPMTITWPKRPSVLSVSVGSSASSSWPSSAQTTPGCSTPKTSLCSSPACRWSTWVHPRPACSSKRWLTELRPFSDRP
jgi:voltage-gated potassium channel